MAARRRQQQLALQQVPGDNGGVTYINGDCQLQTQDDVCLVIVNGMSLYYFPVGDRMAEAHAMVSLVEQGWAKQTEVAAAFGCAERTVRRNQRRFEAGGLIALGRPRGYPKGRPRTPVSRKEQVNRWKTEGVSAREIARRIGVTDKAVRNQLRRLGWKPQPAQQLTFGMGQGADPKLSGSDVGRTSQPSSTEVVTSPQVQSAEISVEDGADPKLSGLETEPAMPTMPSFDSIAGDRSIDRVLACMGLLDDAAPLFRSGDQVAGAGVLLAVPALVDSGVCDIARQIFGSIGPAFYGLRTTIVTLLMMALLRIKRPEGIKEHSPVSLGRLLGLDRSPEVKTLRRKLARLAAFGRAADFGRALAERRVEMRGHALGFLYVDSHVRAYHGKRSLPKTHLTRMRLSMPATTDYWVNDAEGDPLFVVTTEANKGLVAMLPVVLDEVRSLVGDRRTTIVFDRGGWSQKLFAQLIQSCFDILTYRKGKCRRIAKKHFSRRQATVDGRRVVYQLADQNVYLFYGSGRQRKRLTLRQVTRLSDDGHQTQIITSRTDLGAAEVAFRMFERWRQENFFKYLREEYALDALVDYGVEPADETRLVPNPQRMTVTAELRKALAELNIVAACYGAEAFVNAERVRRTMRGFKIANAERGKAILDAMQTVMDLEKKRASIPTRVPVAQVTEGPVIKLAVERKHITDLLKMVAYQAESDLLRLITPLYRRSEDEGRTLVQNAMATPGDIEVTDTELQISLEPLSSPHKTNALVALCEHLNGTKTKFPGSNLRLCFDVKPPPDPCLAFPGSRHQAAADG